VVLVGFSIDGNFCVASDMWFVVVVDAEFVTVLEATRLWLGVRSLEIEIFQGIILRILALFLNIRFTVSGDEKVKSIGLLYDLDLRRFADVTNAGGPQYCKSIVAASVGVMYLGTFFRIILKPRFDLSWTSVDIKSTRFSSFESLLVSNFSRLFSNKDSSIVNIGPNFTTKVCRVDSCVRSIWSSWSFGVHTGSGVPEQSTLLAGRVVL
jgi:hypothetical protein